MIKVNLSTLQAEEAELPEYLLGLLPESLADLSWTDPTLGVSEYGWWPVGYLPAEYDPETQECVHFSYAADPETRTVIGTPVAQALAPDVILERAQARQVVETKNMRAYLTEVREMRERILNRMAGIAAAAMVQDDQPTLDAFVAARQSLLDITKRPEVVTCTTHAELYKAVKAAYASIVMGAPETLRSAFKDVDA